jgi:hypothetical protein
MQTKPPLDAETMKRLVAADPFTRIGWALFIGFFLLNFGSHLLREFAGVLLYQLGPVGRVLMFMPLPMMITCLALLLIGRHRAKKRIEARRSICIACGYNRTGLNQARREVPGVRAGRRQVSPDGVCPEGVLR